MTSIAVIGDVHANAPALQAALAAAEEADALVFIGDLLTYGTDVDEVIDRVLDMQSRRKAVVLRGNHDRFYDELVLTGESAYVARLPAWIRESVDRTLAVLDPARWRAIDFVEVHHVEVVEFSHAGPWSIGDDTYLNTRAEFVAARAALSERGMICGVFGHTHRARLFTAEDDEPRSGPFDWSQARDGARPAVVNVGSIGQPRDRDRLVWRARIAIDAHTVSASLSALEYDRGAHMASLARAGFTAATLERLLAFHRTPEMDQRA